MIQVGRDLRKSSVQASAWNTLWVLWELTRKFKSFLGTKVQKQDSHPNSSYRQQRSLTLSMAVLTEGSTAIAPFLTQHLSGCINVLHPVLGPQYVKDVHKLKRVQRRVTKMVKGGSTCWVRWWMVGDWWTTGINWKKRDSDWIKVNFSTMRTIKPWKRLSREVVPSRFSRAGWTKPLKRPGLMFYLTLLWAGGCTRDLQFLPTWHTLWSHFPHNTQGKWLLRKMGKKPGIS